MKVVHSLWSSYIFHVDRLLMVVANWAHISTELLCLPFSSIFFLKKWALIFLYPPEVVFSWNWLSSLHIVHLSVHCTTLLTNSRLISFFSNLTVISVNV